MRVFLRDFGLIQSAVAPRDLKQMGDDMWRLWFTKLLLLAGFLLVIAVQTRSEGEFDVKIFDAKGPIQPKSVLSSGKCNKITGAR